MRPRTILYAEDEENDIFFLQYALEQIRSPHELKTVPDGQKAIAYLSASPDIDLFFPPGRHGSGY